MRIVRAVLFTVLALGLVASTMLFVFFQTFDADHFRPEITQKASQALGRQVTIGHVWLGLTFHGISLDAGPIEVPDDQTITNQPFITIDRIRVLPDLGVLLRDHKIQVCRLVLISPQIHLIRSPEGNFNFSSLIKGRRPQPAVPAAVKNNILPSSGLSPIEVLPGKTSGDGAPRPLTIIAHDASISFINQDRTYLMEIWLRDIHAHLKDFAFSKPCPLSLRASLYSKQPNVYLNTTVLVDPSQASVLLNNLKLQADLTQLDEEQLKEISPLITNESVFKDIPGIVQLELDSFNANSSGVVAAQGNLSITGGVIKNFNIVKTILYNGLGNFGALDNIINKLGADDTVIQNAQAKFAFSNKTLMVNDSLIQTNILEFTAKGSLDEALNMDMQTMLHLNNNASATLVNEFSGLKYLMDDSQRIAIGANLKGVFPHIKYKMDKDFRKGAKKMLIQEGGNILGVLLSGGKI